MNSFLYKLLKLSILLLFLNSMHVWFTWGINSVVLSTMVFCIFMLFYITHKSLFVFSPKRIIACVLFLIAVSIGTKENFNAFLGPIILLLPICFFICLKDKYIITDILHYITTFFAIFLPISLVFFLLSFIITLPSFGYIEHPSGIYTVHANYIIFIKSAFYNIRFSSIFLEPGHLGMICSYLLFAMRYDFKNWRVVSIFICTLFTLSLAAYVLIIIGFVLILYAKNKLKLSRILLVSFLFFSAYTIAINYKNGNNYINTEIIERLAYDEEKGIIGNNRVYGSFDAVFERHLTSNKKWFGIGIHEYKDIMETERFGGAGWKPFVLQNGILSLIFTFLAYCYVGNFLAIDKKYMYMFLLLLSLSFIQRGYPFWASWLIPFIASIQITHKNNSKRMF